MLRRFFVCIFVLVAARVLADGPPTETIQTKYCGNYNAAPFRCDWITRSSFIRRVCYEQRSDTMLISVNSVYYCYCGLGPAMIDKLKGASNVGQFYNAEISGRYRCVSIDSRYPKT
jgi:KTSC domain